MKNEKGLALPAFFLGDTSRLRKGGAAFMGCARGAAFMGCAREGGGAQGGSEHGEALVVGVKAEGFGAVVVGLRKGAEACVA